MKMNSKLTIAALLLCMCSACKDFIEPSLELRELKLIAPADGTEGNKYQVGFAWEPMEDALYYRLQIATPDFDKPVSLLVDSLVEQRSQLQLTLDPGKYQWRLRAENGSSHSAYVRSNFTIHPTSLEEQKLTLKLPASGYLSNQELVTLSWDALYAAGSYRLQIDTENFLDESKLVLDQVLSSTQFEFSFPKDGLYRWRVRAEGTEANSKWSEIRSMSYDHTPPGKPELIAPAAGAVLSQPVLLSWKSLTGAKKYKLYLYKADGSSPYSTGFPLTLSATQYSFNQGQSGELIYWRVLGIDEAGNEGALTDSRSFQVQ